MMGMYHEMVMGILNPAGIVLDLAIVFVFLFLTTAVIGKKRG